MQILLPFLLAMYLCAINISPEYQQTSETFIPFVSNNIFTIHFYAIFSLFHRKNVFHKDNNIWISFPRFAFKTPLMCFSNEALQFGSLQWDATVGHNYFIVGKNGCLWSTIVPVLCLWLNLFQRCRMAFFVRCVCQFLVSMQNVLFWQHAKLADLDFIKLG